jgi:hypothetical protein
MTTIGARHQEIVASQLDELIRQWPAWTWLAPKLEKAGLTPTSVRELATAARRSSWVILTSPSEALVRHFELAPEVVVLCSPWDQIQANDVGRIEDDVFRTEIRVDPGFALVVTHDPDAEKRLGPVIPEHRRYLFIRDVTLENASNAQSFLVGQLREGLGRRRLFDFRQPAAGPQFFGRERELEALERDVLAGHCLGVYGLRKVGKTSLLGQMARKLRAHRPADAPVLPVEVDLQKLPYTQRTAQGVFDMIARALRAEQAGSGIPVARPGLDPQETLLAAVETTERTPGARVVLILDEYEVLVGGRLPVAEGLDVLEWLRGVAQSHPTAFSLVLAGRDARLLAPARIGGRDNPMYRFLRSMPLTGLSTAECRGMVRKIGARMALKFAPEALQLVADETGGHPGLARTLGDLVDQTVDPSTRNPAPVSASDMRRLFPKFAREVDEDMRELVNAAVDFDPGAEDYLQHLAHGLPWNCGAVEARLQDALVGYGVLEPGGQTFRIGCFGTWLRENLQYPARSAHG